MGGGVAVNIAEEQPVKALLLYCPAPQSEFPEAVQGLVTSRFTEGVMNAFFNLRHPSQPASAPCYLGGDQRS